MQEKAKAADLLVKSVRFLSIKSQDASEGAEDEVNALTLDSQFFVSIEFFLRIMKQIDNEFLIRDYT